MNKQIEPDDAQEQLTFIRSIMEDGQKIIADNGGGFIVWGILILTAAVGTVFLEYLNLQYLQGWTYVLVVAIGWVYMYIAHRPNKKSAVGNPFTLKIINSIWISVLLSMTILGFVGGISGVIELDRITAVLYTTLGIAYFMQGIITGKAWVRNLGFGWWIGSAALYFLTDIAAGILAAAMMIGLQIIPGIIFHRQWKSQFAQD
mgnify:CR=1 FL=1